jgi:hypothetical protein
MVVGDFGQALTRSLLGQAYSGDNIFRFVASYEMMEVDTVYDGPEASRVQLDQAGQRR